MPAEQFAQEWHASGVAALPMDATTIRAVTHIGITADDIDAALRAAGEVLA
jgi:hypothetical protein